MIASVPDCYAANFGVPRRAKSAGKCHRKWKRRPTGLQQVGYHVFRDKPRRPPVPRGAGNSGRISRAQIAVRRRQPAENVRGTTIDRPSGNGRSFRTPSSRWKSSAQQRYRRPVAHAEAKSGWRLSAIIHQLSAHITRAYRREAITGSRAVPRPYPPMTLCVAHENQAPPAPAFRAPAPARRPAAEPLGCDGYPRPESNTSAAPRSQYHAHFRSPAQTAPGYRERSHSPHQLLVR